MRKSTIAKIIFGNILVIVGIVWSIMFPKTTDLSKPDFVASAAIGAGLILSGLIILFLKKNRIISGVLSMLLIWSVAMNLFLFSYMKCSIKTIREMTKDDPNITLKHPLSNRVQ
jgi:predicted acyltransferase